MESKIYLDKLNKINYNVFKKEGKMNKVVIVLALLLVVGITVDLYGASTSEVSTSVDGVTVIQSKPPTIIRVPEPSTFLLVVAGLFGLGLLRKKLKK
jgi:hypothetical protein